MISFKRQLLCGLFLVASSISVLRADDRVFVKQGAPAKGSITKLSPTSVTIDVRGKEQVYAIKEVRKIVFDNEPVQLDRARELALDGKYQQALEELRGVQRNNLEGLVQQDYDFYLWFSEGNQSLAGTGDMKAAIVGLMNLNKVNPDSHHHFEINELLGRLALALASFDNARKFFEVLEQSPEPTQKMTGIYYAGLVLFMQGKVDEAKNKIAALLAASASSPETGRIKNLAAVLNARCDNESGKSQQALDELNTMADREDNTDVLLFAKICNARGDCYQKLNQPQRAAYSYLQTDLLFYTDPESHAEALYHLKNLLLTVGEPAKAAQAKERLDKQYASSVWRNKK